MKKFLPLLFFVFIQAGFLQGCAVALVGGAGAGGYYVGKDERDAATILNDASITASINSKFLTTKGIRTFDINVDTYDGVVYLTGEVPTTAIKNKIIILCKKTKDVKNVVSKLTLKN